MTPFLLLLFLVSIACDVAGQVFFKLGASSVPISGEAGRGNTGWQGLFSNVLCSTWLQAGIATYAVETIVWLRILADVPISIAFPIASLNFLGVALASRWFLGEVVTNRQWAGAGLVTMGVALVARVS